MTTTNNSRRSLVMILNNLIRPHPDEKHLDVWLQEEARAERLANLVRIAYLIIWLLATIPTLPDHPFSSDIANEGVGTIWLLFGIGYHIYLLKRPYRPAQKYFSTTVDVLLNTAILFFYHYDMGYSTSLKAPPFMNYFMMLALAAFRFDSMLPVFGGVLAILSYSGLFVYLNIVQDVIYGTPLELFTTARINFVYQLYRLAYVGAVTFMLSILVRNVHRLVQLRVEESELALAEKAHRERSQRLLEQYFTPEIAAFLAEHPPEMGGEMKPVTVLVSDLRGFTALSEKLGPEQSVTVLNEVFERLVKIVFKYGGTLDKFLGDGMLVVFGTPATGSDDPLRAVQAAQEMIAAVQVFDFEHPLKLGVAIHSGEGIFGNIGSPQRMELTIIGDVVNTTSRIEELNKEFGTSILLSDATYQAIKDTITCQELEPKQLRGKTEITRLYTIRN